MGKLLLLGLVVAAAAALWLCARLWRRVERTAEPADAAAKLMIVPHSLSPAYYFFLQAFAKENSLNVIVDRRATERRRQPGRVFVERRGTDRRGPLPAAWNRDGFILAPVAGIEKKAS